MSEWQKGGDATEEALESADMKILAGKQNLVEPLGPLSDDPFSWVIDKLCALSSNQPTLQHRSYALPQQDLRLQQAPTSSPVITAYTPHQQLPRSADIASLLKQSGKSRTPSHGRLLHFIIISYGIHHIIFLANCLIEMYGLCGCLLDAQSVFDRVCHPNVFSWNILINAYAQNRGFKVAKSLFDSMPFRDVVSWNAIITASAQNGQCKEALALYHQMIAEGVCPSSITFVCALDACASEGMLEEGQLVYAAIVQEGYEQDCIVGTALITMYGKCRIMECAWEVFRRIGSHNNVVSWTSMIGALAENAQPELALLVFKRMQPGGIAPNNVSFVCAINACTTLAQLEEGLEIHAAVVSSGSEQDIVVGTSLINMYGKCDSLQSAMSVFSSMEQLNVVSWNAIISALNDSGCFKQALLFFCRLQQQLGDTKPDSITFVFSLEACANLAILKEGCILHAMIIEVSLEQDIVVGNALIDMYGKCRNLQDARSVFSKMRHGDAISWTSLIASYAQIGCNLEALDLFQQMHIEDVVVGNALIELYSKCGNLKSALDVFTRMPQKNVVSWTVMLSAYASNGFAFKAVNLFHGMNCEGIKANEITFINVLTACSRTGHFNDGWHLFSSILTDHHIAHTRDHFICMVDLLGRAGLLKEAEHLINNAPFESMGVAWSSLLGACKLHSDMQHGLLAADHCFQLDPKDTAPYVLLSNMYK